MSQTYQEEGDNIYSYQQEPSLGFEGQDADGSQYLLDGSSIPLSPMADAQLTEGNMDVVQNPLIGFKDNYFALDIGDQEYVLAEAADAVVMQAVFGPFQDLSEETEYKEVPLEDFSFAPGNEVMMTPEFEKSMQIARNRCKEIVTQILNIDKKDRIQNPHAVDETLAGDVDQAIIRQKNVESVFSYIVYGLFGNLNVIMRMKEDELLRTLINFTGENDRSRLRFLRKSLILYQQSINKLINITQG